MPRSNPEKGKLGHYTAQTIMRPDAVTNTMPELEYVILGAGKTYGIDDAYARALIAMGIAKL